MKNLSFPDAFVFDWDNTLVQSWDIILEALNHTFYSFSLPLWTMTDVKNNVRASLRDSFPQIFGNEWLKAQEIFYNYILTHHLDRLSPEEGAEQLLDFLLKKGVYLAIVSNKKGDILRKEVQKIGWLKYFNKVIGAGDASSDKPSIEPVTLALADLIQASHKSIWFVGDTDIDMLCAKNSNCVPVLVRKEAPQENEFNQIEPVYYFPDCINLMSTLSSIK
ncbi:MAG: HAD family hydrolase [Alphaproteobacteria bacterium]|nr:HAD family hydrolase [Alphaproteobacteria bacterium]